MEKEKKKKNVQFDASPSDCELIMQLLKFVAGKRSEGFIGFTDVYSKEPWELIGESSKKTHYFFTQLKKKNRSDTRFNRATRGGGSWTQLDKGKVILDEDEKLVIGYKRSLNFKHKKDPSLNGQWMMKEYFLADFLLRQLKKSNETKDFVICAIKKNPKSVIKGTTSDDVLEYKRFIDRVLQHSEEPKDGMLLLLNHTDDIFGMENQEKGEGENQEPDWLSLLDFGDHALLHNRLNF